MALPSLPPSWEEGYDWMGKLSGGWHEVPGWGEAGWDCGSWPYVIVAHCNADSDAGIGWGVVTYVEGDIEVKEFPTREERDKETDKIAVFYWSRDEDYKNAPQTVDDPRLGPYRRLT